MKKPNLLALVFLVAFAIAVLAPVVTPGNAAYASAGSGERCTGDDC